MDNFKEFQGNDLDECIREACAYFDSPREKLEIEIIQDAKSGIFGIVGARKAKIRARRASLRETVQTILGGEGNPRRAASGVHSAHEPAAEQRSEDKKKEHFKKPEARRGHDRHAGHEPVSAESSEKHEKRARQHSAAPAAVDTSNAQTAAVIPGPSLRRSNEQGEHKYYEKHHEKPHDRTQAEIAAQNAALAATDESIDDLESGGDGFHSIPIAELDATRLENLAREVVGRLVKPVAGQEVPVTVEIGDNRIRAKIDWQGDAGLLIGREGQTLAAMQYLASRMISKGMNAAVRVHLDIGDYRRKQDDKLGELARNLAEKARKTGRAYSTRPLSSYHRRIVHLCLQDDPDVQTRSSGDGPLKRVLISPKRPGGRT